LIGEPETPGLDGGCRIKPSRKSRCAIAEMAARVKSQDVVWELALTFRR
jgi:hypothetical protein